MKKYVYFGKYLTFFRLDIGKINICSDKMVSVPSKAVVSQLDNPAWLEVSHQTRTELDVY